MFPCAGFSKPHVDPPAQQVPPLDLGGEEAQQEQLSNKKHHFTHEPRAVTTQF